MSIPSGFIASNAVNDQGEGRQVHNARKNFF